MVGLFRPFGVLLVFAGVFSLTAGELQSKVARKTIIVKGPSASGGSASENLAATCAQGFNEAYARCLGGANSYLMILVANHDDTKAYCAYTGGWAQTTEYYPHHRACFASPGQSEALYFDSARETLVNWNKETVVSAPLKQDQTSLSCTAGGDAPCESTVTSRYARQLTKGGELWQEVPAGGSFTFTWHPSDGYIGVVTKTPQQIFSMFVMDVTANHDDTKAYCAYTGGWAQTTEYYPHHRACFASPGQSEALYFDSARETLVNWNKETVVSAPLKQDQTSLSCTAGGDAPCESTVTSRYARQLTKGGELWQEVPAGGSFTFTWHPSDGYIGVVTKTPQQIFSMFVMDVTAGSNGLSSDVPCRLHTSVEAQARDFPVKGLKGPCQKYSDTDYWMEFGIGPITICFPDVSC